MGHRRWPWWGSGHRIDAEALRVFLGQELARYKQPKRLVVREQLPKTASGKLDKVALHGEAVAALMG